MSNTLAIVDDDPFAALALIDHFAYEFPELVVETFHSGPEIMAALANGSTYDVVMMDGKLPDEWTGPKYTSEIIREHPRTVVIGLSSDEDLEPKFIKSGAKFFICKTFKLGEIDSIIQKALDIVNQR